MDKMNHSSAEAEPETIEALRYLSKGDAAAIETELFRDYRFGQQQLIELWGQACALAITKAYPLSALSKKQPTVLVICGPDQNGSIGLVCARYLRIFVQLINDAYNLVIDAMLGIEEDSSNIKEPYSGILVTLKQIKIPIVSVDVPSGWDADEPSQDGINPEVLISLMAPKKCALNFSGKHFLAGRFLPYDIQKKYELNLPDYAGTDCLLEL
ncbi:yjeF N-terminal domain-containing 3 isoform X2 [Girardinichthys multiradiatus]|uniref:yjeF N-terminal domain-containing 3 isoform X2 n=1 Tax=Girardinichthys multiradiatus TaxID=208333 RepID=UPI001FAB980B|nr:yjeF N-terminal domain-containing 3 isoform X2 [Girardinichthys multiradiatus]